jgi:hypothetical protein
MGWSAGLKLRTALANLRRILAVELVVAARAVELRAPLRPSPATATVIAELRRTVPGTGPDRWLSPRAGGGGPADRLRPGAPGCQPRRRSPMTEDDGGPDQEVGPERASSMGPDVDDVGGHRPRRRRRVFPVGLERGRRRAAPVVRRRGGAAGHGCRAGRQWQHVGVVGRPRPRGCGYGQPPGQRPERGGRSTAPWASSQVSWLSMSSRPRRAPPRCPVAVVCFSDEEGARFGVACVGSRLTCGALGPDAARALADADGVTLAQAMKRAGADPAQLGPAPERLAQLRAFVEVHIEQGRALVDLGAPIGLATRIWPHGRWRCRFQGEPNHAGTTLMADRRDPMVPLALAVIEARRAAERYGAPGHRRQDGSGAQRHKCRCRPGRRLAGRQGCGRRGTAARSGRRARHGRRGRGCQRCGFPAHSGILHRARSSSMSPYVPSSQRCSAALRRCPPPPATTPASCRAMCLRP